VRDGFGVEAAIAGIDDLGELNRLFAAWLEGAELRMEC
jgi:hypothetical protein